MSFPPPPVESIDWDDIGFKVREGKRNPFPLFEQHAEHPALVNGHIESHYKNGQWSQPKFVQDPFLRIHGLAPGLNYGQQAYEGMKAFRTPDDQIALFRPTQNADRMAHSASFISIPAVPLDRFLECCHLAVSLNAGYVPPHRTGAALYVRPLLFGSSAQLGLNPPEEYTFCVYVIPVGVYHGVHPVDALILEDFDRAAPKGTGSAKIGGNYAPVLRWSERAKNDGFGITLHLDSKTQCSVDEFSTSGFIGVKKNGDDVTIVVPKSDSVIKSITSDSVCEIARSLQWKVECRTISYDELPTFDEVMAAGTAAALVPIKSITMRSCQDKFVYGGNDPGPICLQLLNTLQGIQQGKIKDTFGWLEYVKEATSFTQPGGGKGTEARNGSEKNVDNLP